MMPQHSGSSPRNPPAQTVNIAGLIRGEPGERVISPTAPDMSDWSILDFELAYDGISQIIEAAISLQNQPRSLIRPGDYHPGADFIVQLGEDWCGSIIGNIVDSLTARRFPDPRDDDRRVILLVRHAAIGGPAGDTLAAILNMAFDQSAPITA